MLVRLYQTQKSPDYLRMAECLVFLDDAKSVADILNNLLKTNEEVLQGIVFNSLFKGERVYGIPIGI